MATIDFSRTIIAKSDQLNAADLAGTRIIKITDAVMADAQDQPVVLFFDGDTKRPWKPCKTMRRLLAMAWGEQVDPVGRYVEIYTEPTVTWAGAEVGGIRVTGLSHIEKDKTFVIRVGRNKVMKFTVRKLGGEAPAGDAKEEPPKPEIDAETLELIARAKNEAEKGVQAYKGFLYSLPEEEKGKLRIHHPTFSKIAKDADELAKKLEEPPQEEDEGFII